MPGRGRREKERIEEKRVGETKAWGQDGAAYWENGGVIREMQGTCRRNCRQTGSREKWGFWKKRVELLGLARVGAGMA